MKNSFLKQIGKGLKINPSKYRLIRSYDEYDNPRDYWQDLEFEKIAIDLDFLKELMNNPDLKLIDFRVICYILMKMENNSDEVILNPNIIKKYVGRETSTISASLLRLRKLELIYPITGKCKYDIHPLKVFKGKRMEFLHQEDSRLVRRVK